jgi:putative zinc finger protein
MSPLTCRATELSLGALAVGALEEGARAEVDDHLAMCRSCTATLAELDELTALMAQVSAAEAEAVLGPLEPLPEAPPTRPPETHVPTPVRPRFRRRLIAAGSLGAAAVLALVVAVAAPFGAGTAPTSRPTHAQATDPQTHVSASATLRPVEVGTELTLQLSGVPTRQACQLVVVGEDGRRSVASSWLATYAGTARVTGTTSLSQSQIAQLVVSTPDGRVLVSLPMAG